MTSTETVHAQALPPEEMPAYARVFMEALAAADVKIVAALPESHLKALYVALDESADIDYIRVSNEADLPGIVAGAYLAGARALMICENSGIRQACEPIARFSFAHQIPLVIAVAYRGAFGEANWWGHNHAQVMHPLLQALRIPLRVVSELDDLRTAIDKAFVHADASQWPVCLAMTGECIEGGK